MTDKLKFFLFVAFTFIFEINCKEEYVCQKYTCNQTTLDEDQCLYHHIWNNTAYYINEINKCKKGKCIYFRNEVINGTCKVDNNTKGVDSEDCKKHADCYSNNCSNHICIGKKENESCNFYHECQVGLFCFAPNKTDFQKQFCSPQLKEGATCQADHECDNNLGCYLINNTCLSFFSLKNGERSKSDLFCQSGKLINEYCVSTSRKDSSEECQIESGGKKQTHCSYDVIGLPENEEKIITESCECSRNYVNRNFCPLGSTDQLYGAYILAMKKFYGSDKLKMKHSIYKHSYDYETEKARLLATKYPIYKDADTCAIDIDAGMSFIRLSVIVVIATIVIL